MPPPPPCSTCSAAPPCWGLFIATDPVSASTTRAAAWSMACSSACWSMSSAALVATRCLRLCRAAGQPVRTADRQPDPPESLRSPSQMIRAHLTLRNDAMLKSMRKTASLALFALACTAVVVLTNELTQGGSPTSSSWRSCAPSALLPEGAMTTIWSPAASWCRADAIWAAISPCRSTPRPSRAKSPAMRWKPSPRRLQWGHSPHRGHRCQGRRERGAGIGPQGNPGLGDKIELKKSDWINSFVGKFQPRQ